MGPADARTLKNCIVDCEVTSLVGDLIGEKSETLDLGNVSKVCKVIVNNNLNSAKQVKVSVKILYNGKQLAYEERIIDTDNVNKLSSEVFIDLANTKYEEAVKLLNGLGIINGYPDGTFKPENTITRAEFTAIMTKFSELKVDTNESLKFFDVMPEHWARGYIEACADKGLVSGYLDGSFKPDNNVKYSEAITILINALGYKDEVALNKVGWPYNYTSKSAELGLHNNVSDIDFDKAATRGDIAILTMNAYFMK